MATLKVGARISSFDTGGTIPLLAVSSLVSSRLVSLSLSLSLCLSATWENVLHYRRFPWFACFQFLQLSSCCSRRFINLLQPRYDTPTSSIVASFVFFPLARLRRTGLALSHPLPPSLEKYKNCLQCFMHWFPCSLLQNIKKKKHI